MICGGGRKEKDMDGSRPRGRSLALGSATGFSPTKDSPDSDTKKKDDKKDKKVTASLRSVVDDIRSRAHRRSER